MKVMEPVATGADRIPWRSRGVYRVMEESRADLIGQIVELYRQEASIAARRAELVDQARQWAEVTESASNTRIGGWDAHTVARKQLVTELATALKLPERTVENLVEESETLIHDLQGTFAGLLEGKFSYAHANRPRLFSA
jgi:hypothetical protein